MANPLGGKIITIPANTPLYNPQTNTYIRLGKDIKVFALENRNNTYKVVISGTTYIVSKDNI